jgi:hypothetical protein
MTRAETIAPPPPAWLWPAFLHDCAGEYSRFCDSLTAGLSPVAVFRADGALGLGLWRDALHAYADALDGLADALWPAPRQIATSFPRTSPLAPLPE